MHVIEVRDLTKDYKQHFWSKKRRVLDGVSFNVSKGEVFGFLGPNGSGKSTTIKILFEIVFPTAGSASLLGHPIGHKSSKRHIGFLPENPYFYEFLSAWNFLFFHGRLLGLDRTFLSKRIPEVLDLVGMQGTDNDLLRNFSKGMLQRIGLAQAILHDPELVILDEPMTGLDPLGRREIRDLMVHLRDQGKTVFFSTHILSDVEMVCDRIAILNQGKLLKCGYVEDLISVQTKYVEMIWLSSSKELKDYLKSQDSKIRDHSGSLYLKLIPDKKEKKGEFEDRITKIVNRGIELGGVIKTLSPKQDSLEDVFVRQIGRLESRV